MADEQNITPDTAGTPTPQDGQTKNNQTQTAKNDDVDIHINMDDLFTKQEENTKESQVTESKNHAKEDGQSNNATTKQNTQNFSSETDKDTFQLDLPQNENSKEDETRLEDKQPNDNTTQSTKKALEPTNNILPPQPAQDTKESGTINAESDVSTTIPTQNNGTNEPVNQGSNSDNTSSQQPGAGSQGITNKTSASFNLDELIGDNKPNPPQQSPATTVPQSQTPATPLRKEDETKNVGSNVSTTAPTQNEGTNEQMSQGSNSNQQPAANTQGPVQTTQAQYVQQNNQQQTVTNQPQIAQVAQNNGYQSVYQPTHKFSLKRAMIIGVLTLIIGLGGYFIFTKMFPLAFQANNTPQPVATTEIVDTNTGTNNTIAMENTNDQGNITSSGANTQNTGDQNVDAGNPQPVTEQTGTTGENNTPDTNNQHAAAATGTHMTGDTQTTTGNLTSGDNFDQFKDIDDMIETGTEISDATITKLQEYYDEGNEFLKLGKLTDNRDITKFGLFLFKKSTDWLEKIENDEEIDTSKLDADLAQFQEALDELYKLVDEGPTTNSK